MPGGDVIGREPELGLLSAFLDRSVEGPAGFVIEGEPGIGKSMLWLTAVAAARERGLLVVSSRPAEAERGLTHVGLGDLFEDVLADVAPLLSTPRRRALEVALLHEEAVDDPVDHRALGVAVRDVLHLLGERKPTLVAVDDVQWLDPSSSSALAFALRRLPPGPVLVLLARRLVDGTERSGLEQALDAERVQRLRVGPLGVGALRRLLDDRFGSPSPARPCSASTSGRAATRSSPWSWRASSRGTSTRSSRSRSRRRWTSSSARGSPGCRRRRTTRSRLPRHWGRRRRRSWSGRGRGRRARPGGRRTRDRARERLDPLHPPAAVVGPVRRPGRAAPERSPTDCGDRRRPDRPRPPPRPVGGRARRRDRHRARRRRDARAGAWGPGGRGELAEQAVRLTPSEAGDRRRGRALAAARAHQAAGEWTRARTILADLLAEGDIGPLRAEALALLAELESLDRAVALLEEALRESQSRPALRARIQCRLAWATRFKKGFAGALEHARAALELADQLDDDTLRVEALAILTFLGCAVGDPEAPAHAARAHDLATAIGDPVLLDKANGAIEDVLDVRRNLEEARALLERSYEQWHERDELLAAEALSGLAYVELWSNRWQLAAEYADRAYELNVQYRPEVPWIHLPTAVIAAHRGQPALARAHSERSLRLGEEQIGLHPPMHLATLGVVALQDGDPRTALDWFDRSAATTTRLGWGEPGRRWWVPDHVEALLAVDRANDAARVLDAWEADARRLERDWVLAHVTRCRGLVAAARGDVSEAASLLEDAVTQHETFGDAFGRARALLALGVVRRRERQKRAARDAIGAALGEFERLGAATWIEKARAELGRIGGRTREEGLTAAERRVAALVAEGRTNREVAAALFLGERTVETHLSHVYAKLGVRSRAELARRFRPDEQGSGELTISS